MTSARGAGTRDCASDINAIVHAASTDRIGCHVISCGPLEERARRSVLDAVRDLGFVLVTPEDESGGPAIMRGRHIALVVSGDAERLAAASWVRVLSRRSPRGHVVLAFDDPAPGSDPAHGRSAIQVRESSAIVSEAVVHPYPGVPSEARRVARAGRLLRRRRLAAGDRWTRATMAAAGRRGNEPGVVNIAARMIEQFIREGALDRAMATAERVAADVKTFPSAAEAAALVAHLLTLVLELTRAEAWLAGAAAEACLRRVDVPCAVQSAKRNLLLWTGRLEEARALARTGRPATVEDEGMRGLVAWACLDRDLFWTVEARLAAGAECDHGNGPFWRAALQALHAGVFGETTPAVDAAAVAERLARAAPPGLAPLARAITAEMHSARGDPDSARRALDDERPDETPLFALLCRRLRERLAVDRDWRGESDTHIRRTAALGVNRWGQGGAGMQLLHEWPVLLDIVQEADDDLTALTRGCAWVRRQSRAEAVAVVDAEGTSWVASDGWARQDLATAVVREVLTASSSTVAVGVHVFSTAGVRYAGRTIGRVIARGSSDHRLTQERAVQAFAALAGPALRARLDALALARSAHALAPEILGRSPAIAAVREVIARAAATTFPVLIEGESGTGKELVARALHRLGPRRDRRFCGVNCAAFTDELFEAELFGYARGAFTGAIGARAGLIEDAHDGTLFLDEVSDLTARAQAKLLRTLQEREVRRLGENLPRAVDVRVIAATNLPLTDAVGQGRFREDLLFRLAVVRIRVPPLRERPDDIALLAQAFWRQLEAGANKRVVLGPDAMAVLCQHRWPGNVRELQNVLSALVVLAPGRGRIGQRHVAQVLQPTAPVSDAAGLSLDAGRRLCERRMITAALARHGGRRGAAARELGVTRQGLAKAMRRLDLDAIETTAGVA